MSIIMKVSPPRGYSAYEIAVQQGYEGTEAQWLELTQGFYKWWLGAKASDPITDNEGDALRVGAKYFNTVTEKERIYNGATWNDTMYDNVILF